MPRWCFFEVARFATAVDRAWKNSGNHHNPKRQRGIWGKNYLNAKSQSLADASGCDGPKRATSKLTRRVRIKSTVCLPELAAAPGSFQTWRGIFRGAVMRVAPVARDMARGCSDDGLDRRIGVKEVDTERVSPEFAAAGLKCPDNREDDMECSQHEQHGNTNDKKA